MENLHLLAVDFDNHSVTLIAENKNLSKIKTELEQMNGVSLNNEVFEDKELAIEEFDKIPAGRPEVGQFVYFIVSNIEMAKNSASSFCFWM